jgi:hypothetical protein
MIQCARVAFGFVGIYDPDEAERIRDAVDVTPPVARIATRNARAALDDFAGGAKPEPTAAFPPTEGNFQEDNDGNSSHT